MSVIGKPDETESTLDALLATTFVIRVDRATLSVIAPLLSKCLRSRQSNMHRKAGMVRGVVSVGRSVGRIVGRSVTGSIDN